MNLRHCFSCFPPFYLIFPKFFFPQAHILQDFLLIKHWFLSIKAIILPLNCAGWMRIVQTNDSWEKRV